MLLFQQNLQSKAYSLIASVGSFVETGQNANIKVGRTLIVNQGSLTLTGQQAVVKSARNLTAGFGAVALLGNNSNFTKTKTIQAQNGFFGLSGQSVQIQIAKSISVDYGGFNLVGNSATISKSGGLQYTINADNGVIALVGKYVQFVRTSPTTGGAKRKRVEPTFQPPNYREQILKEDENLLMLINEIMRVTSRYGNTEI
mgnify:CR=1 FL=1